MIKKLLVCFLCAAMSVTAITGCSSKKTASPSMYDASKSEADYKQCLDDESGYKDMANYTKPKDGEEIIVMKIANYGDVKIKLFPELLPKACANFVGLAKKGYYDGLTFHRVIADFMIQGGDPMGTGMGGQSIWGAQFDGGHSKYLNHVKGALAYANSGSTSTDGSQFYIVVGDTYTEELLTDTLKSALKSAENLSDTVKKAYIDDGGTPFLDGDYTVFGQVFEGLDIVENICNNTETGAKDKPVKDVIIEKVQVENYKG